MKNKITIEVLDGSKPRPQRKRVNEELGKSINANRNQSNLQIQDPSSYSQFQSFQNPMPIMSKSRFFKKKKK